MEALTPLKDTERLIDWEELPASVREIPDNFDPMAAGVLMKHQVEWLQFREKLDIAVCEKGRRTGITFDEALDDSITVASSKEAGGDNIWYIADTREKGLEFIGYMAKFLRVIAKAQGQGLSRIEQYIFKDQNPKTGETKDITAWRIRCSSGFRASVLSSRPENIHGLQGIVVIDEAALHKDVGGVLESATALLIWGGKIRIISTHRGKKNPFNELIRDIRNGLYGKKAGVYRVTFDDAVANGLYERMCWMTGKEATVEGKKEWYTGIRAAYGPRTAAMREELDAIPRDGSGVSIPGVWIENAMPEERPVLRLVCNDNFASRPEIERKRWCEEWIKQHLIPVLEATIDLSSRYAIGMDFARHRHFSIIMPAVISPTLNRDAPFLIELANVPTRQQEQILWTVLDYIKSWTFAGDATGPGQTLMEYTGDRYGRADPKEPSKGGRVHEVLLTRKWYAEWMKQWIDSFEDGTATYPRDASLESDFRAVEDIDGIPMVPKVERKDIKEPELFRHGDGAIAAALMWFASMFRPSAIEYTPAPDKHSRWDGKDNDDDFPSMGSGARW